MNNILDWINNYKESIVKHIDSLDYKDLKKMHIECEKDISFLKKEVQSGNKNQEQLLKERTFELQYITDSLEFCKQNISNDQYRLLEEFARQQYFYKHRNENPKESFNSQYWANLLDENNISWSIQNLISDITDTYDNKGKYLSTHLKNNNINIGTLENRAEILKNEYIKEFKLNNLVKSFEESIPEIRFAIKQYNYDAPAQLNEVSNSYEEAYKILEEKYIKNEIQSVLSYSAFEIVAIDKNNEESKKEIHESLLEIINKNLKEDTAVLIDSKSNKQEFSHKENNDETLYKVYLYREEDFEPKFNIGLNREHIFKQFNTKDSAVVDFYLTAYQELKDNQSLNQENINIRKTLNKHR